MSLSESGVPALRDDLEARPATPPADIGTERAVRSLTLVMGPVDGGVLVLERGVRGLNAAMLCDTPSARMNCSRSSMLVRPLARQGSFFTRNSSRATHPPPTRTITVERRIRTRRSFWESPNLYFPSPTWNTLNFCLQVQSITSRFTSS